jgi:hypothetical protein
MRDHPVHTEEKKRISEWKSIYEMCCTESERVLFLFFGIGKNMNYVCYCFFFLAVCRKTRVGQLLLNRSGARRPQLVGSWPIPQPNSSRKSNWVYTLAETKTSRLCTRNFCVATRPGKRQELAINFRLWLEKYLVFFQDFVFFFLHFFKIN